MSRIVRSPLRQHGLLVTAAAELLSSVKYDEDNTNAKWIETVTVVTNTIMMMMMMMTKTYTCSSVHQCYTAFKHKMLSKA